MSGVDFFGRCRACGRRVESSGGCHACASTTTIRVGQVPGLRGIEIVDPMQLAADLRAMLVGPPPLYNWPEQNRRAGYDQAIHEVARRLGLNLEPFGHVVTNGALPSNVAVMQSGGRVVGTIVGIADGEEL